MRIIWNILSVLAVANLLAIGAFVAWLGHSDRLSTERLRQVRVMLSTTIADEAEAEQQREKEAEEERARAEADRRANRPPMTAAERLSARMEATELDRQRIERLKREVHDLQRQLEEDRRRIAQERAALDADKREFEQLVADMNVATGDAQFQKTLRVLQAQKPAQAVVLLKEMITEAGAPVGEMPPRANGAGAEVEVPASSAKGMSAAVAYLDAMSEKTRTKIIDALTKTDPKLAAELLERLRQRGEFARVP